MPVLMNNEKMRASINGLKLNAYLDGNKVWGSGSTPEPEARDYFQFTALETGKVLVKNRWKGYINVNGSSVPKKGNITLDVTPGDLIIIKEGAPGVFATENEWLPLINELVVSADKSPAIEMFSISDEIVELQGQFVMFDWPSSIQRYSDTFLDDSYKIKKVTKGSFYQSFPGNQSLKYNYMPKAIDFSGIEEYSSDSLVNMFNYRFGSKLDTHERIMLPVFPNIANNTFYFDVELNKLTSYVFSEGETKYKLYLKDPLTDEEYYSVPAGQRLEKFGR